MNIKAIAILVMLVILVATVVPSEAWRGGRFHGGFHRGCCWWGPAIVGGLALGIGAALAYPFYAAAAAPVYAAPPPVVYVPPPVVAPPPVVYQQPAVAYAPPPPAPVQVQREVVYPHGKYLLYGDGVSQPWQWVWVPAPAAAPVPPYR